MANRSRWLLRFVVPGVVVLGVVGYVVHRHSVAAEPPTKGGGAIAGEDKKSDPKAGKGDKKADGAARTVPVVVAKVERKDVPIWLEGLGSVAAWQQVTVRPQVDGVLQQVLFKEGQTVHKGDPIAQIDPRPFEVQLHQAEGALVRDKATLTDTSLNLARNKTLLKDNLVSQQVVDDQQALVGQAEGATKIDQAQIESAKLNLDYARVRSPLDGVVGVRLVDAGNLVHATDAGGLVVVTQLDPAAVFVTLPQDELGHVVAAQHRGEVRVEVYARDAKHLIATGRLAALDNQINTATSTLRIKAQIPNADHQLWPNQFVKARLLVDTLEGALVVPAAAVQRGPQGTFVYVVEPGKTAAMRAIDVKTVTGDSAIISGKIDVGEDVVVEGQAQLRPGAMVSLRHP